MGAMAEKCNIQCNMRHHKRGKHLIFMVFSRFIATVHHRRNA